MCCARIDLLRGKFALAAATAQRWRAAIGENRFETMPLLELLGEAEIGQAQTEAAAGRGTRLAELGSSLDCRLMLARGERLRGRALVAASDLAARRHLMRRLHQWRFTRKRPGLGTADARP